MKDNPQRHMTNNSNRKTHKYQMTSRAPGTHIKKSRIDTSAHTLFYQNFLLLELASWLHHECLVEQPL